MGLNMKADAISFALDVFESESWCRAAAPTVVDSAYLAAGVGIGVAFLSIFRSGSFTSKVDDRGGQLTNTVHNQVLYT
ncbi:hypothetical protein R1flu_025897 [Riccia fluitans]|uniref:Uncharacterized protein n=1 Tax=Riccia fluitans TaxID=41844 RepID=A0ABD1XZ15_9MARC